MRYLAFLCFCLLAFPADAQTLALHTQTGMVDIDVALLRQVSAGEEVTFAVDDQRLVADVTRLDRTVGRTSWTGTLREGGSAFVTVAGAHAIVRIDSQFGVWIVERRRGHYAARRVIESDELGTDTIRPPVRELRGRTASEDAIWPDAVEALVLYTPGVVAELGDGLPVFVQAVEDAFVASVEAAGGSSGALRVVHHAVADYPDGEMSEALLDLSDPSTPVGRSAADLRDAWGADVVQLITADEGPGCGVAFVMDPVDVSFAPDAFGVAKLYCAVATLVSPHEFGHNMGLWHDPYVGQYDTPYPYGHGFVNTESLDPGAGVPGFRTVMSYRNECRDLGGDCPRVPHFSSATVTLNGQSTGDAELSNAVRAIGESLPTVTAFRTPELLGARAIDLTAAPLWTPPDCPDVTNAETCTPGSEQALHRTVALDPTQTGRYLVRWDAPGDLFLYRDGFDPASPTANLVALARFDSEAPETRRTLVEAGLEADVSYTLVVSATEPDGSGALEVFGFGAASVFPVSSEAPVGASVTEVLIAGPNPFRSATSVSVELGKASPLRVELVDALGRLVRLLHDGEAAAGTSRIEIDGATLAPGVYSVRVIGADAGLQLVRMR